MPRAKRLAPRATRPKCPAVGIAAGGCAFTVTLKAHVALTEPDWAVQLTTVVPTGNAEPEGGAQLTVGFGQVPLTVGGG
jgi:hypothetical protein